MKGNEDLPAFDSRSDEELLAEFAEAGIAAGLKLQHPWAKARVLYSAAKTYEFLDDLTIRKRLEAEQASGGEPL